MVRRHHLVAAATALMALITQAVVPPAGADEVAKQKAEIERAVQMIEDAHYQADVAAEDYAVAVDEQRQLQADIKVSKARVVEMEATLGNVESAVRDVALQQLVAGEGSGLEALLGSADLSAEVQRNEYAALAVASGTDVADQLDSLLNDLAKARKKLDGQLKDAQELGDQAKKRLEKAEQLRQQAIDLKQQSEQRYGQALAEAQQRKEAAEEAAARQRIEAEAAAAAAAAARARQAPPARGANTGGGNSGGGNSGGGNSGGGNSGGGNSGGGNSGGGNSGGGNSGGGSSGGGGHPAPPPSPGAAGAVAAARSQVGVKYRFAAASPGVAFDCSGLTSWAWSQAGVGIPRQSRAQFAALPRVPASQVQPGDLIFYYSPVSHVGMYIGDGLMVHAPNTGSHVNIAAVRWAKVVGVGRPG